jgi:acylphosphatase
MSAEKQRLEAVVRGYVQGVGFRAFVVRQARALGLVGWVENREDGAVQVVAEGSRPELLALADRLHDGPSEAEVQDVELSWQPCSGSCAGFEVRH